MRQYGTYVCIEYPTWLLYTAASARPVRDDLAAYVDAGDRVFIAALNGETAWLHMPETVSDWLHRYLATT